MQATIALIAWGGIQPCAPPNDYILNAFFKRELKIIKPPTVDQVEGTVTVYWKEGIDDYNVTIKTVFRILE